MTTSLRAAMRATIAANQQFVKFLLVGVLNSAFGYGCYVALTYVGLHYSIALFFATIFGVLFNFKTTGRIVFQSRENRLILRFVAIYALIYAINVAGVNRLLRFGLNAYVAAAVMILPLAVLAYILNKRFVFEHA